MKRKKGIDFNTLENHESIQTEFYAQSWLDSAQTKELRLDSPFAAMKKRRPKEVADRLVEVMERSLD